LILPQFYSVKATKQNSQNQFYGLQLKASENNSHEDLHTYSIQSAEEDGTSNGLAA